jgi:hypothetical protein
VGRAAFEKGSIPRAVAMPSHSPHASRPSTFRAPGWGAPALPSSCCCWRSATSWGLAPFSHRSASRIFIMQPGCSPSPMVIQDDDRQLGGGEKQAGLRPLPHPQLQGSSSSGLGRRAGRLGAYVRVGQRPASSSSIRGRKTSSSSMEEASSSHAREGELPLPGQGATVRPPPGRRSCRAQVAAVTGLVEGANFDNAGPAGRERRQLQRAWHAGSAGSDATSDAGSCRLVRAWLSVHRTGNCRAARRSGMSVALPASPTTPGDRPRRRTPLGRRSCSWIVLSSLWHDASARRSVPARLGGLEWGSAGAG